MSRPLDLLAWGAALLVAAWLLRRVSVPRARPRPMTDEPLRIVPPMILARGEFPPHGEERPHAPFTREEARRRAWLRLLAWRRDHGQR